MAVCNIFKPLKNPTGTFYLFSQYTEDLARESTQSEYYRVTPSKFIALDINYKGKTNELISKDLQDKFENGCAVCRSQMNDTWTPKHSSNLFWNMMLENKYINVVENNVIPEIKYVGDINMQSYNEIEGMGYSEIFCYIPTESKSYKQTGIKGSLGEVFNSGNYIEGYSKGEVMFDGKDFGNINSSLKYYPNFDIKLSWEDASIKLDEQMDNKYNINTIIVLYDVASRGDGADNIIYKDIPMGIYFTGAIQDGTMSNPITKFVSNPDIYGSGTSYGLKICSRFTCTPNNDNIKTIDVTIDTGEESIMSYLLSQMSISQNKMDDILKCAQDNLQYKKDLLAIFKNYRVNVPYIKNVNDKQHWFVNGRDLGEIK